MQFKAAETSLVGSRRATVTILINTWSEACIMMVQCAFNCTCLLASGDWFASCSCWQEKRNKREKGKCSTPEKESTCSTWRPSCQCEWESSDTVTSQTCSLTSGSLFHSRDTTPIISIPGSLRGLCAMPKVNKVCLQVAINRVRRASALQSHARESSWLNHCPILGDLAQWQEGGASDSIRFC